MVFEANDERDHYKPEVSHCFIDAMFNEDEGAILITYTKPCHGTAAIKIPISPEEIESVRAMDIGTD